jgi:hypothetical protein
VRRQMYAPHRTVSVFKLFFIVLKNHLQTMLRMSIMAEAYQEMRLCRET